MSRSLFTTALLSTTLLVACGDKGDDTGGAGDGGTTAAGTDSGDTDGGDTDAGGTDSGGTDAGGTDAGGTDSGSTDDGGTDSGGGGGDYFLQAAGEFDGNSVSVVCDASQLIGASAGGTGPSINIICTDIGSGYSVAVAGIGLSEGTFDECSIYSSVQVTEVSTAGYYACTISGASTFQLSLSEYEEDGAGNVVWGGAFQLEGDDGTHSVSISGSFRGQSLAP